MTLDEAIEYARRNVIYYNHGAKAFTKLHEEKIARNHAEQYEKFTQFYEWLKELKEYKENKSRWIYDENDMDYNIGCWKCGRCGCKNTMIPKCIKMHDGIISHERINPNIWEGSNFCPNCGADMRK